MDIPLHKNCPVIESHPCGLLAIDKASGVLSHPNKQSSDSNALLPLRYDHEKEAYVEGNDQWFLLNRLDGPTSGVILLADDPVVVTAAKAAFADHQVTKNYLAVVKGIPPRKKDIWKDCLEMSRKAGQLRTRVVRGRPNAESNVMLKERASGPPARSLVQLNPSTGRTHQLRVQCASRRLPIVGDATYGDFEFNRIVRRKIGSGRLFLHSWRTSIELHVDGVKVSFSAESELPGIFAVALQ